MLALSILFCKRANSTILSALDTLIFWIRSIDSIKPPLEFSNSNFFGSKGNLTSQSSWLTLSSYNSANHRYGPLVPSFLFFAASNKRGLTIPKKLLPNALTTCGGSSSIRALAWAAIASFMALLSVELLIYKSFELL